MAIQIPLLNSVLPSIATGIGGIYTAFSIFYRKEKNKEKFSFAVSWLLMGSVFFLAGLRLAAFAAGFPWLDKIIFYVLQRIFYHV